MKQEYSDRDISSTFARGMAVLRAFDDNHTRLTLADIARATDLDRATVRRLALTLVHLGYAWRDGKYFSLSPRVLTLAGSFLRGNRFGTLVQPYLNQCSNRIEATVSLAIIDGDSAVYVAQSTYQDSDITFGFTVGSRLPLLPTAIGRALLAAGEPKTTARLIADCPVERYTADTLMNRNEIKKRVTESRKAGCAVVTNEFEAGVTGIAVPVNSDGETLAAVGMSAPVAQLKTKARRAKTVTGLTQLAQQFSRTGVFSGVAGF